MHLQVSLLVEHRATVGVIDFRSAEDFAAQHIRHALHIDGINGLNSRFSWLPPPSRDPDSPGRKLVVICRGASRLEELQASLSRWNVVAWIFEEEDSRCFWIDAIDKGLVACKGEDDTPSLLFEPSPLIEMAIQACEDTIQTGKATATVLDLGCGAGRDLAYIVRRKSKQAWLGTGVDNLLATVERARLFVSDGTDSRIQNIVWAQASPKGTLQALQLGLNSQSKTKGVPIASARGSDDSLQAFAADHLPCTTFDLILLVRFLPRPLLLNLSQLSHAGTIVGISHFTTIEGEEDYPSPDASKRFEEKDVQMLLQEWGPEWSLYDQVIHRAEDARPLRSVLLARCL
jgi:SAM-dependent methyltransferase/rhodanese-related sulfurtransferase